VFNILAVSLDKLRFQEPLAMSVKHSRLFQDKVLGREVALSEFGICLWAVDMSVFWLSQNWIKKKGRHFWDSSLYLVKKKKK
jgi:hypothetical protein